MRFLAPVLLALCALPIAAQVDPGAGPEPPLLVRDEAYAADLKAARAFADLLDRAGEPDVTQAIEVLVPIELQDAWLMEREVPPGTAPVPTLDDGYLSFGSNLSGWLLPSEDNTVRVLLEDGLVHSFPSISPTYSKKVPYGLARANFQELSSEIHQGHHWYGLCIREQGAWRLAHWAAWQVKLNRDDRAVDAWRNALRVQAFLVSEFPEATPADRLVLAGAREFLEAGGLSEGGALAALDRVEALTREPLGQDVAKEILEIRDHLEETIALRRGYTEADSAKIHELLVQERAEVARDVENHRRIESARREWIEAYTITPMEAVLLPRSLQAEYWIHQLPEWNSATLESDNPGRFIHSLSQPGSDPCQQLFALGEDALPALVDAACEPWRTLTHANGRALTVGDVCAFMIEQILGVAPLPHAEGDLWPGRRLGPEARKQAFTAWWNELKPLSAEDRWIELWKRGSPRATEALIRIDARNHLPALVERVEQTKGRSRCIERGRLVEALRALPEGQLKDLEAACAAECYEIVREAQTK